MKKAKLIEIANIQVGYQAKKKINESAGSSYRLIQGKDFNVYHRLNIENLISFMPKRNPEPYTVCMGDILFQARGVEHFAHCFEVDVEDVLASGSFYIIRLISQLLLPEYLAWWINQEPFQSCIHAHAASTAMSFVSKDALSQIEIHIPSLTTQKKVVHVLKSWEREQLLCHKLMEFRSKLVKATCMQAVQE